MRDAWRHGRAHSVPPERPAPQSVDWRSEVEAVAHQLKRLSPDAFRPERYHERKSELVGRLYRLARR
jgi:hypothetical protein